MLDLNPMELKQSNQPCSPPAARHPKSQSVNEVARHYEFPPESPPSTPTCSSTTDCDLDLISCLPKEIALEIFSLLDVKDLAKASQTCSNWYCLANDNILWKNKSVGLSDEREVFEGRPIAQSSLSTWKLNYARHFQINANWRHGAANRNPNVLLAHGGHVITCLLFTNHNRLISTSDDGTVRVWSLESGSCIYTLTSHNGGIWAAEVDGNLLVTGSTDRTVRLWDLSTGEEDSVLFGHSSTVRCLALKNGIVVSGSRDYSLRVWTAELEAHRYKGGMIKANYCKGTLLGHHAAVRCVCYDGEIIVSGSYDFQIRVWSSQSLRCLHVLIGHTSRVYSLQFDGVYAVSGSLDASIRVWDTRTGKLKHILMGHDSLTSGMLQRGNILVSGNADSTVRMWDITTGACLQTLGMDGIKHDSGITCVHVDQNYVVTSSDDGTVKLWDLQTGSFIRNIVTLQSREAGGVVWRILANKTKLVCAVGSRDRDNQITDVEETKILLFDYEASILQ